MDVIRCGDTFFHQGENMKKKLLLCSILAGMSVNALAGSVYIGPSLFVQKTSGSNSSYTGMYPHLSLGYSERISDYYFAGEVFGAFGNVTISNRTNRGAISSKIAHEYGASFIPGIFIREAAIAYLRLGVVNAKFAGPSATRMGAQAGVGLQTDLSPNWDLRGEYVYSAFKSVAGLGSPKTNELGVGVIYKFD